MSTTDSATEALPFIAPCRILSLADPLRWLRAGFNDMRRAPAQSLGLGIAMAAVTLAVSAVAWRFGSYWFLLAILSGFVFMAPLFCIGTYAISAMLERNQPVEFARVLRAVFKRYISNEMLFALVLLVVFLIWARAASMVHVFFPVEVNYVLRDLALYLVVGTGVGAIFACVTFSASAFSLPMIMHRDVDSVTAVVTSINAVLRNKLVMLFWLAIIMVAIIVGVLFGFVGLAVTLPLIGHATWHAYLDTIDVRAFPRHSVGITAVPRLR